MLPNVNKNEVSDNPPQVAAETDHASEVDENLLDALGHPGDRIAVLQIEQLVQHFLAGKGTNNLKYESDNSYLRLLAHKVGSYYNLNHVSDPDRNVISFEKTPLITLPLTNLCDIAVSKEQQPLVVQSKMQGTTKVKIMRRDKATKSSPETRSSLPSSDNASQEKDKIDKEERYRAARARIFQGVAESDVIATEKSSGDKTKSRSHSRDSRQRSRRKDVDEVAYARNLPLEQFGGLTIENTESFLEPSSLQQRHSQYFQQTMAESPVHSLNSSPVLRAPTVSRAIWNSRSTAPLSMANLAQLEAQTAQQVPSAQSPLFFKANDASSPGPARQSDLAVSKVANLWSTTVHDDNLATKRASAMGLNLSASPWTPKNLQSSAQQIPRTILKSPASFETGNRLDRPRNSQNANEQ